jgi:hypothetical protein
VIECTPALNAGVFKFAWPALRAVVPRLVDPSKKVTVPVGVPVPDNGETVAVKITGCPNVEGLSELTTVVVVARPGVFTNWLIAAEVLFAKLPSPPNTAVIEWFPTPSRNVVNVAVPPLKAPLPKVVLPSRKRTVPVATNEPRDDGLTVAVNVTFCPCVEGFGIPTTVVVVVARVTVSINTRDVLGAKVESPP